MPESEMSHPPWETERASVAARFLDDDGKQQRDEELCYDTSRHGLASVSSKMTRTMRSDPPLRIPISALLPPPKTALPDSATAPLPSPAVILGPLPSTSPLHLALNYLSLADIPDFASAGPSSHERALIITGSKKVWQQALEEEDEDWTRDHGGDYGVLHRLKRIDVR